MSAALPPLIELRNVRKAYRLGDVIVPALRGVTLTVGTGEFTALTGPSGSGKSTLLHLCGLLDPPDEGTLTLEGLPINGQPERRLALLRRRAIGFVFQGFNLVPVMTAFENVEYPLLLEGTPRVQRRERVAAVLERVGLEAFARHRPDRLSGGQKQRVAIARALVKRPTLVIADEPTANLDTDSARRVIDLMRELSREQGTTFLIATHDARMAERCDRRVELIDGVIP